MAADIEVPTWVNVRWLFGSPAALVEVPVVVFTSEKVRRKVGTSIAGAAKSVVALRFAAPVIRSLYIRMSAAVYVATLADTPAVVVPVVPVAPVVPVVPLVLVLAVPPMVSALPKTSTGPSGSGMAPIGGSVGIVEGLVVNGNG